jgi:hypothetical protein
MTAVDRSFPVTVTGGGLTVQVSPGAAGDPVLNALEILSGSVVTPPSVAVSVSPANASLSAGQTRQFSATVTGASNTSVTWSISPTVGTVSSSGLYTAPATIASQQTVAVIATSQADPSKSAVAPATLTPAPTVLPPGPVQLGTPRLNWPNNYYLPLNGTLTVTYPGDSTGISFEWTFTSKVPGISSGHLAAGAPGGAVISFRTPGLNASLGEHPLQPGAYGVSVTAVDSLGNRSDSASADITVVMNDLSHIQVFPNPWRKDKHDGKPVTFNNLPDNCTIKLFGVSGHLVREWHTPGGTTTWDLANDSGDRAASGVYLYAITCDQGNKTKGKLAIIR